MKLTSVDWLIMLLYFVFVLGIGFALKRYMKTSKDFFQAGRALPAWICGLAFISANLGAQEVIGMGASGAKYGLETAHFYGIGAIPAMIFVGIFMMPFYYGSKARSVPEFLRMRFDEKTRALNACSFAVMTVFSSGISMYAMARLIQALHVFDGLFHALGWAPEGIFTFSIVLSAVIVLLYIFLGGLTSAIYNEVLQFFLIIAGFLPLVLLGLKNIGGWAGLKASVPVAYMHEWKGVTHANTNPMGIEIIGLGMGLGFVLGSGYWCTDFLVIQTAMASKNMESARRVPLIAAIPKMFFPFLVILPGLLAIGLPTPHTTTTVHTENGVIYHETNVVSKQVEEGRGLVPAKINPVTGQAMLDASGHPLLDYDMATPNMLLHFFPTGILGPGPDRAAGQLHERHGGQRDGVQHRVHLRPLPVLHSQGRQRPALHGGGPMGHGGRHSAVDCDGLCGHQLQQHHGHAATGVQLCECAAVCHVFAGHVLEADHRPWRVFGADCGHGRSHVASRADAAPGGAARHSWRVDHGASPLPQRHGAEFLGCDLGIQRQFHCGGGGEPADQAAAGVGAGGAGALAYAQAAARARAGGSGPRRWPSPSCLARSR